MMPSDMVPSGNFLASGFGITATFQSMMGSAYPYYVEDGEVKYVLWRRATRSMLS